MRTSILQTVATEISNRLKLEMIEGKELENSSVPNITLVFLPGLAETVAQRLSSQGPVQPSANGDSEAEALLESRLRKVELRLRRLTISPQTDAEAEVASTAKALPNPEEAKSKYGHMDSILKYVDASEEQGGLRLVIMNFND